ncbi:hypothetical protein CRYUN_Cryun37aG0032000 [Craigia yunnanensis]
MVKFSLSHAVGKGFVIVIVLCTCWLFKSSGCLGCYKLLTFNSLVNESSKGLKFQGQSVRKASISEDFWTASTCDMDNSALHSQGSISSVSTSNQTLDPGGNAASTNAPSEFVNHDKFSVLKLYCTHCLSMVKQLWLSSWNATYESLLGSNKPFPQPIPLAEIIDFLVDVREQEGFYD